MSDAFLETGNTEVYKREKFPVSLESVFLSAKKDHARVKGRYS